MSKKPFDRGRGRGQGGGESLPMRGGRGGGSQYGGSPSFDQRGGGGRGRGDRGGPGRGRGRGAAEIQIFKNPSSGPATHDPKVGRVENELMKSSSGKTAQVTQRMPPRPGFGTQGKQVMLWANYFELVSKGDVELFRYSIDLHPPANGKIPAGKKLKRIIDLLLQNHFSSYKAGIASDYRSNLISRSELLLDETEYSVDYRAEGEDEHGQNGTTYQLRLQYTGTVRLSELMDYLTSTNASAMFASKEEVLQALNIVMGQYPKSAADMFSIGANKHFKMRPERSEKMDLGAGLEGIRGFFVSVRAATARLLVNVQVKHVACYQEGPLAQSMGAFLRAHGHNRRELERFLKRVTVDVSHIVKKNKAGQVIPRRKVIVALAARNDGQGLQHPPRVPSHGAGAREVHFHVGDSGNKSEAKAKYISVYDFFKKTYQITVKDPTLPVVNVGSRQSPSYLPADVCVILPGQASASKLSPEQTQQMIRFAVRRPDQNAQSVLSDGGRIVGTQPPASTNLNQFGLVVGSSLIAVPGRELTGPAVKYAKGQTANARFGSWNLQRIQFSASTELKSWSYLFLCTEGSRSPWQDPSQLDRTLQQFQAKLSEVGVHAGPYTRGLRIMLGRPNSDAQIDKQNDKKIDEAIHTFAKSKENPRPQFLLVILPSVSTTIYNRVKYICDVKEGLKSVCVVAPKFAKEGNDQYFANVALKFNLKLGGQNQLLDKHKLGVIGEGKTMVVGVDVTHPSPGSASAAPSVAGIVASIDRSLAQWPADLRSQAARQEKVSALDIMLKSRLRLWAQHNGQKYPENILVYRDGVSEGQYASVLNDELPLLRRACAETYPANDTKQGLPRMSIIVVGKRHHTRFYPTKEENADRSSNPHNGTVVDRGVTEARNWDFFLQAHTALQGTARPAHYYVVLDEIFRGRQSSSSATPQNQAQLTNAADALEDLTHNMCYLFGRATKAVSICPPAYYADLVCERARCYLTKLFDGTDVTPSASVVSGAMGSQDLDPNELRIHENVKDSMFYI